MNWLLVGIGDVAIKRVLPAFELEPRSALYGVVTRDLAKGKLYADRVWTDLAEALADPSIDAVYLATPVFLHAPQALAALRAGKHVLCEKPLALDYAQAEQMVLAARTAGRLLGAAYFRRMYPKLRRAKQLLALGVIGSVERAIAACSEWHPHPDSARPWLDDPRLGGSGPLYDIGCHRIDALNDLLGEPARVTAQFSFAGDRVVEESATVLIEYAAGARASLEARWDTQSNLDEFRLIGTRGEMDLSPLSGPTLRYPGQEESWPCHANRHYPCIEDFVSAVCDGTPLACSARASLPTAWVLTEALKSGGRA